MSNSKISPQEFHLLADNPHIRTNCPQALITDQMVGDEVKRGNLVAGDRVMVQCFNHDYTELLAEAEYRVVGRRSKMETVEVDHINTRQFEKLTFEVSRVTDWRFFAEAEQPEGEATVKAVWNVGRGGFIIEVDGKEVGFEKDKDTAKKIEAGKLPLPQSAAA